MKSAVSAITEAIDAVFTALRNAVATIINAAKEAAVGLINAARTWVVDRLNDFRDWAKEQVDTYLRDSFPGLADALDGAIDTVVDTAVAGVDAVADAAVSAVEALADGLASALDGILGAFQTALTAAVGILGAVLTGDFAGALRIAIQAGCDIAGVDSGPIFQFIERAGQQIMAILSDLPGFFNNLLTAVGTGIRNFGQNILQHLQAGLIGWLTGALGGAGITPPATFDLKGIFGMVAQILGLTYENVKARVIRKFPRAEGIFARIEQGMEIIQKIREEGIAGLWAEIQERLSNLREMVIGTIRTWVMTKVIQEGILWLISLLNPASALARVLKLMFDLVMWLVERFAQIRDFVMSVYEAVTNIAAGVLQPAAAAVENALARSLPVVISLIASVLGLGGISAAIQRVVQRITRPINRAIDAVIDRIVAFARRIIRRVAQGARNVRDRVVNFLWPKKRFTVDGESHTLDFKGDGTPIMRSSPQDVRVVIDRWVQIPEHRNIRDSARLVQAARAALQVYARESRQLASLTDGGRQPSRRQTQALLAAQNRMATALSDMMGSAGNQASRAFAQMRERYNLEGLTGSYSSIPEGVGDEMEADHQPQNAIFEELAAKSYFAGLSGNMVARAANRSAAANTINLHETRHGAGRTYGGRGTSTKTAFMSRITNMEARTPDPADRRERAVGLIFTELRADVAAMQAIYRRGPTDVIWNDIDRFIPQGTPPQQAQEEKEDLIGEIRTRVQRGEQILSRQPLRELRN